MSFEAPGTYPVTVVEHGLSQSDNGREYIAVQLEHAEHGRIWWYGYFTDKSLEITLKALEAMGWDPSLNDGDITTLDRTGLLNGNAAEVVVDWDEYDGKRLLKAKWVNKVGGSGGKPMDEGQKASFAGDLRKRILSAKGPQANRAPAQAPAPAPVPAANVPPEPLENLPF